MIETKRCCSTVDVVTAYGTAHIFSTAYVSGSEAGEMRPVVFAFGGGPGSSSAYLHYGLLGPRVVEFTDWLGNAAAQVIDHESPFLAVADVVLCDPVGSGFSTASAADGHDPTEANSASCDAASLSQFIYQWMVRNGRARSPIFLVGESYGAVRVSLIAECLMDVYDIFVDGIVVIASALMRGALPSGRASERDLVLGLPSKAMAAAFHGLVPLNGSLVEHGARAGEFALTNYQTFLFGGGLSGIRDSDIASTLHALTGVPEDILLNHDLRLDVETFVRFATHSSDRTLARYDARVVGPAYEKLDGPAADESLRRATAAFSRLVFEEIGIQGPHGDNSHYVMVDFAGTQPWRPVRTDESVFDSGGVALAKCLRRNAHLRVLAMMGTFDLVTPALLAYWAFDHMRLSAHERDRVAIREFPGGHMMYIEAMNRIPMLESLAGFVSHE